MSARRFRARLDRLERSIVSTVQFQFPNFTIDLQVAKSLRDEYERWLKLMQPRSSSESEEEERLRASIADRARAIGCPADYGYIDQLKDQNRRCTLDGKRMSPVDTLTDAEDAEHALLRARICAFDETPEGRARNRINELDFKMRCNPAEQEELDSLRATYPDLPYDENHPYYNERHDTAFKNAKEKRKEWE